MKNTLTRLRKERDWEAFEKKIFFFMTGNIFTAFIYWALVKTGYILITYK